MIIGVCKETFPSERRVAIIPEVVPAVANLGLDVIVEKGCGLQAGISDSAYQEKGATVVDDRNSVFSKADIVLQVRCFGANPDAGQDDLSMMRSGQTVVGFCEPLSAAESAKQVAETGASMLAMELVPRITRAQSMDALSSMATIAGYKAVLIAANTLPKIFPMFMTAAGTIKAAKVFIMGAGVAGLQAIATAKRLGAIVSAYDVRPAVKEQVESLGAKFIEVDLETQGAEDKGGYAKEMGEEFYRKQREVMSQIVSVSDVVITTAAVPGGKSPILVTAEMVHGMAGGSVIVDLAAERGGNCALTKPDETIVENNVTILGPTNLASTIPFHASQMYAKNLLSLLKHLVTDGNIQFDLQDEITRGMLVTHGGQIVHARMREILGLPALPKQESERNTNE